MHHDVIVVGAGAAGSLIAGRLAAETELRVLVLEAGGRDTSPSIHMPAGFSKLLVHEKFIYPYATTPQAHLDGRRVPIAQGKGVGGGTSVNALCYVRGQPADYDGWDAALGGDAGWSYADLLPHFTAMEGSDIFSNAYHGAQGPLSVSQPARINPLNQRAIRAFQESGLAYNADYNGAAQRGVGPCQTMVGDAKRCSSATAFLHPAEGRSNLTVDTGALVTSLIIEGGKAVGVEVQRSNGVERLLSGTIVVAAGAINTPRLLMLSGIGPEDELRRHGIELRVKAQGVGANLHDHPAAPVDAHVSQDLGYAKDAHGIRQILVGLEYLLLHNGPAASNGIESSAYFNPVDPEADPTIQVFHSPVIVASGLGASDKRAGLTMSTVVLHPKSRGSVRLKDADPRSEPLIDPNYFSHPDDMATMVQGLKYVRDVFRSPSLASVLDGAVCPALNENDEGLMRHARATMNTMWHPVGTCRMGADDGAVVDGGLRVRGVDNLFVADSSVMPRITSGNTTAPTFAIASKGVDAVRRALSA